MATTATETPQNIGSLLYQHVYKPYYEKNKQKINDYRRESGLGRKCFAKYYETHKEEVKAKNLARYHRKKAEQDALKASNASGAEGSSGLEISGLEISGMVKV